MRSTTTGEGATGPFFHAFLALLNPQAGATTATVTSHLSDGSTVAKSYAIAAVATLYCSIMFLAAAGPNGAELGRLVI